MDDSDIDDLLDGLVLESELDVTARLLDDEVPRDELGLLDDMPPPSISSQHTYILSTPAGMHINSPSMMQRYCLWMTK